MMDAQEVSCRLTGFAVQRQNTPLLSPIDQEFDEE
jgi:hypothetical protein